MHVMLTLNKQKVKMKKINKKLIMKQLLGLVSCKKMLTYS